mmetsp:Transcript_29910/g.58678  ORF Transcript_29910/g.58678 Transcript_29910/m.58678 type:complete len:152 (-) Transcript_29910:285-740(-)
MHASIALTRYGGREMGVKSSLFVERKGKSLRQHGMKERKKQIETVTHRKPDGQTRVLRDRKTSRQAGRQAGRQTDRGGKSGRAKESQTTSAFLFGRWLRFGWMDGRCECVRECCSWNFDLRGNTYVSSAHLWYSRELRMHYKCAWSACVRL